MFYTCFPTSSDLRLRKSNKSPPRDRVSSVSPGVLHQTLIKHHIPAPMWPSNLFLIYQNETVVATVERSAWCLFSWFWWMFWSLSVFIRGSARFTKFMVMVFMDLWNRTAVHTWPRFALCSGHVEGDERRRFDCRRHRKDGRVRIKTHRQQYDVQLA